MCPAWDPVTKPNQKPFSIPQAMDANIRVSVLAAGMMNHPHAANMQQQYGHQMPQQRPPQQPQQSPIHQMTPTGMSPQVNPL